ncbi:MAG: DUF2304 family protein [Oligosphaeraceae bacterium]
MTLIQLLLIAGLALAAVLSVKILRRQLPVRLFLLLQLCVGVIFVIHPDSATRVAALLGVGRGTDLILYFLALLVYVGGLCILSQFRRLERQQTLIIRELALQTAQPPDRTAAVSASAGASASPAVS